MHTTCHKQIMYIIIWFIKYVSREIAWKKIETIWAFIALISLIRSIGEFISKRRQAPLEY